MSAGCAQRTLHWIFELIKGSSGVQVLLPVELLFTLASTQFKAVESHHFSPCINEVSHKHFLCIIRSIDFCDSAQLGVRPENKVNGGGCPFELGRPLIKTLVNALGF